MSFFQQLKQFFGGSCRCPAGPSINTVDDYEFEILFDKEVAEVRRRRLEEAETAKNAETPEIIDEELLETRSRELAMKEVTGRGRSYYDGRSEKYESDYQRALEEIRNVLRTKRFGPNSMLDVLRPEDFPEVKIEIGDYLPGSWSNRETDIDLGRGYVRCTKACVACAKKHGILF
jgi:hypothetical protein